MDSKDERKEAAAKSWQYRAIAATQGNQTKLGCILIAVLGKSPQHGPPRFGVGAIITLNGLVVSRYQDKMGQMWERQIICEADELVDNFRRLADQLKLSDGDRKAMFEEVRKWIVKDERANAAHLFNVPTVH